MLTLFRSLFAILLMQNYNPEQLEKIHQHQVSSTFLKYRADMIKDNSSIYEDLTGKSKNTNFYKLNQQRKRMMMERALNANQDFLDKIIETANDGQKIEPLPQNTKPTNFSKIKSTIKQFYREWCSQSFEKQDYSMIKAKCSQYLKEKSLILVPGCGLGRLVLELVEAGFGAQGNEVTYFMLYGSNFILNCSTEQNQYEIYPFIHNFSYYQNEEDWFRSVRIPDKVASKVVAEDSDFSIAAGEFTEVYNASPDKFDGVTTCFFIDTANNIFDYIDTIWTTLKSDGIWINYGPLLFHYREMYNEVSIEVSWEILRKYILKKFTILEQNQRQTTYCHDPKSTMSVKYQCLFFVAKKINEQQFQNDE